jgi:hypothetical protein
VSSPARLGTRIWGTFGFSPARPADGAEAADHYRVDAVVAVRGDGIAAIASGWHMTRTARPDDGIDVNVDGAFSLTGTTQQLLYTDGAQQAELARVSHTGAGNGPGTVAVLIPITKSEAWWALPLEARAAPFRVDASAAKPTTVPGHTAIGAGYANRIFRRLYHARYLPGASWDFLTYFEMRREDVPAFRELLGKLRDPALNPEWTHVAREVEIWTTRL